ncbi:FAD-binding oxidoreductase [Phreatobacter aquaticus]|uniref:FAD-binding oxidoreductase n=1 Tax=Phreatobacter aquaticus TaxID=2570229 RepID=A0A4D7QP54_9HYPH|nr:FAD-binding oxidoreductase [Phreatobacter aquaticus]QCK85922.1 FAD-binding oxidoreductase [Phreatobacter aquaticus]
MSEPIRSDVIIVGGGIMGAATAFFLAKRGRSVALIERGLIGQQASGTNFGNVRRQGRFLPQLPLANRSRAIWGRLGELLGEDAEFLASGHIRVAYAEDMIGVMETYARDARAYDLELEMLSGNALRDRFPFLGPEVRGGSYSPHDGHANPRLAAPAFGRAAARAGAQIFENTEIVQVEKDGAGFRVESASGQVFRAPVLMISAGAWANRLSAQFGEPVAVVAHGPQMAVTEPVPYAIEPVIGVSSTNVAEGLYLRQVKRGNIVFGGGGRGPADTETRRATVEPMFTLRKIEQIARVVPALSRLSIIRVWSGIEGYPPDELPIIGPSAKVDGLHYAFGFSGHGFQLGPGVGDVMAELIDTGQTSTPIEAFSIRRFLQPGA